MAGSHLCFRLPGISTMLHSKNRILSRASPVDFEDLWPHLRLVEMEYGQALADSGQRLHQVYFPHSGIISCVVEMEHGSATESGMIGNDGVFGATQALDDKFRCTRSSFRCPVRPRWWMRITSRRWRFHRQNFSSFSSRTRVFSSGRYSRPQHATLSTALNSGCANGSCVCTTLSAASCR